MLSERRTRLRVLAVTLTGALTLGLVVSLPALSPAPAYAVADNLPTWNDVQNAKKNQASADRAIKQIEALIVQVQNEVAETRAAAEAAATKLFAAEALLRDAEERVEVLETQAAASQVEAENASSQAAALVSQMYRSGGVDRSFELFLESDESTADALLDQLAQIEKATERNTAVSDSAEQAMNTANSLGEQASSARDERDRLRAEAKSNQETAAAAAAAASEKLAEQEAAQETLETQLAALKDKTTTTVSGYQQRLKLEAAERARLEAEAIKNNNGGGTNNGGGANNGGSGPVTSSGWVRPLSSGVYRITSGFWGYYGHTGIDLAAGSGTPIYAASSGTVIASGWFGANDYGNGVFIQHAGGVTTRYAHMVRTPSVRVGQNVSAGQVIGYVGTTGNSTGNHLHFETRVNGSAQNPATFMAARGIRF